MPDISLNAVANLGYADGSFARAYQVSVPQEFLNGAQICPGIKEMRCVTMTQLVWCELRIRITSYNVCYTKLLRERAGYTLDLDSWALLHEDRNNFV